MNKVVCSIPESTFLQEIQSASVASACHLDTGSETPEEERAEDQVPKMLFGQWLKQKRLQANLTQPAAAKRAGISQNHWYRIERRMSHPRRETILRLVSAVNADLEEALLLARQWLPEEAVILEIKGQVTREDFEHLEQTLERKLDYQSKLIQRLAKSILDKLGQKQVENQDIEVGF